MIFLTEVIMGSLFCIRAKPGREHTYVDSEKMYSFDKVSHIAKVYIISGLPFVFMIGDQI